MKILITGGTSGLGKAIAEEFLQDPENEVVITYNSGKAIAEEMQALNKNLNFYYCNFKDPESVNKMVDAIEKMQPDVLINGAFTGINQNHFVKTNEQDWLDEFQFNVVSTLKITKACIKAFKAQKFGRIINILSSSISGAPPIGYSVYSANKSYLLAMSKSWATELVRFNITSNCVSPGFMLTKLTDETDIRIQEMMKEAHPLKEFLLPKDVAKAVIFLAQSSNHYNGINMFIDGGMSMQ